MSTRVIFGLWVVAAFAASTVQLPQPSKQPSPQSAEQRKLVQEGVQLHDLGDYKGAIQRFERALLQDANDVSAIYELSYTLMAAKEYKRSLEAAMKGAEYESRLLPDFYALIGSDYDELGEPEGAAAVYRQGMRKFPNNPMLPFNFAITCERMKRPDEARRLYETALKVDPSHSSSHFRLAALFGRTGYPIPGLLAHLRFLELARDKRRQQQALQSTVSQLLGAARSGGKPNEVTVTLNLGEGSEALDEGDYRGGSAMIGLGSALQFTEEGKKFSRPDLVRRQLEMLFETFANDKKLRKEKKKFTATYYVPYFREMESAHHTEAFTYVMLRESGWPEVAEWVEKNPEKVKAYREWAASWNWGTEPPANR